MIREELERKLNDGQELTKGETKELKCIIVEEEFLYESKKPLSEEDIITMSNALNEENITIDTAKEYLDDLTEVAYESTWINGKENYDEEYTNTLHLIIAKLENM